MAQEVESTTVTGSRINYLSTHLLATSNVAKLISIAEAEGIPKKDLFVLDSMTSLGISFLCRELSPVSPTVSKCLGYAVTFDCAPKT